MIVSSPCLLGIAARHYRGWGRNQHCKILLQQAEDKLYVVRGVVSVKRDSQTIMPAGTNYALFGEQLYQAVGILGLQHDKRSHAVERRLDLNAKLRGAIDQSPGQNANLLGHVL